MKNILVVGAGFSGAVVARDLAEQGCARVVVVEDAVSRAADAFDAQGQLVTEAAKKNVQAVIDQVLWAAQRFAPA